jgi:aspartokinase
MWRRRSLIWEMPLSYRKQRANGSKSFTEEPSFRKGTTVGVTETLEIFPLKVLRDLIQLNFLRIPARPGATRPLFDLLERHNVSVKFLLEGCTGDFNRDLVICIVQDGFSRLEPELKEVANRMQAQAVEVRRSVAVIRVLGPHFDIRPGTSGLLFEALDRAGITVLSIATTITSSMLVIPNDQVAAAERVIGRTFDVPKKK